MGGGNHVGEAQGSMSYLPITKIERPQFDSSIQHVREWYESVIETVRRLANILSGTTFPHRRKLSLFICVKRNNPKRI